MWRLEMKKKTRLLLFLPVVLWVLGCAENSEITKSKAAKGAAIGAVTGAIAGGIIGHQSGHRGAGVLIGGAAGAVLGATIGDKLDQQAKELEQIPNTQVERKEDRLVVTMSNAVLFDIDSAALKPDSTGILDEMSDSMVRYRDTDILVKGHTDSTGSEKYNQELSERRATSVRNYLIDRTVSPQRITAIGFGKTMPVASNDTAEGRQQNRRVEVEIKPKPEVAS
jgi:outer membrane protein OmpA-like peptidoglycan-associated protein